MLQALTDARVEQVRVVPRLRSSGCRRWRGPARCASCRASWGCRRCSRATRCGAGPSSRLMSAPVFCSPFSSHQLPNCSLRTCWLWQYMHPFVLVDLLARERLPLQRLRVRVVVASFWYGCSPLELPEREQHQPQPARREREQRAEEDHHPAIHVSPQEGLTTEAQRRREDQRSSVFKLWFPALSLCALCALCG